MRGMVNIVHTFKSFIIRNAPTILTCVGTIGVISTAALTADATIKAVDICEELKEREGITTREKIKALAPIVIPPVLLGAGTIACFFGANILSKKQQASMISVYALLDQRFKAYRDKVEETCGEGTNKKIDEALAEDNFDKYKETLIISQDNKMLFYDDFSGRYFESTIQHVKDAEYNFNRNFTLRGFADLNEWYEFVGLEPVEYGYYIGWSMPVGEMDYGYRWVDFAHHVVTIDDGLDCCIISMPFEPHYDYNEANEKRKIGDLF